MDWLTPELIAAVSAGVVVILAAWRGGRQLEVIRADVNSNMTKALQQIDALQSELAASKAETAAEAVAEARANGELGP